MPARTRTKPDPALDWPSRGPGGPGSAGSPGGAGSPGVQESPGLGTARVPPAGAFGVDRVAGAFGVDWGGGAFGVDRDGG